MPDACVAVSYCFINYHKISSLQQHIFIPSTFTGSWFQVWLSWVLCSGSHKTIVKMSVEFWARLEFGMPFSTLVVVSQIYFLAVIEFMVVCFFQAIRKAVRITHWESTESQGESLYYFQSLTFRSYFKGSPDLVRPTKGNLPFDYRP